MSYKKQIKKMSGLKSKEILLFALSTCIWCKKTKELLKDLGLEHNYVDVDLLFGSDREEAYNEMRKHKSASFPTIVINNGEDIIIGYEEEKLKSLK